jgi:inosine-uridine nucleoside N-ribohydrolase
MNGALPRTAGPSRHPEVIAISSFCARGVRWIVTLLVLLGAPTVACAAPKPEPQLIYFDNDFLGPGETSLQSLVPLIRRDDVRIVGLGVVTGDGWLKEEAAHLLRFLEIAGRPDIPVVLGAEMPLMRTPNEMRAWEAQYGTLPWLGAWNPPAPGETFHPDDPSLIPPMPEGAPTLRASSEGAVSFLIRTVRANPGKVTIVAAGPLTNIALALRSAPDLPSLAKEIVIEGGNIDDELTQATLGADDTVDFNFLFDPEAAHIVLTAPWRRVTVVGDVATSVRLTQAIVDRIAVSSSPVAQYLKRYAQTAEPFWDEITAAVAVDRTLVTKEVNVVMDVDTMPGMHYGRARIWSTHDAPQTGVRPVHLVLSIDAERFVSAFIAAAQR